MITNLASAVERLQQRRNGRVVVFLGAGASKPFGYPLTSDLLTLIVKSLRSPEFLERLEGDPPRTRQRNQRTLQTYLNQLLPGKNLRRDNLPLVTSLLSLLDYSLATGQSVLAARSLDEVRFARRLVERAILEMIAEDEWFGEQEETLFYGFCTFLTALKTLGGSSPLTIITTNYDMAADLAAFRCARIGRDGRNYLNEYQIAERIDFGFQWLHPEAADLVVMWRPRVPIVSVLKLHGSTNWLRCPLCDNVYVNPWGPIWVQAFKSATDKSNVCHCSPTRLEVQIVSPSYVREMREPNLLSVWKSALDELRSADEWLIVGYSFPDEDLAVRALFTRAYGSREDRPHITVVQRDESAFSRYDAFFAPEALTYCVGGLESFLGEWRRRAARQKRFRRQGRG